MTRPSQRAYLQHIRDALQASLEYSAGGRESFFASRMIQDAVVRNLEIVGEAAKGLDDATKQLAPEVPWRRISGMRDVLVHHYFGVDLQAVWGVIEVEARTLLATVERLIAESESGNS
jgi:uncharacterized protein with HEPN domain